MSDDMRFEDHLGTDLDAWLDDRLPPARAARVERHLSNCQECSDLARAMQEAQATVREAGSRDVLPEELEGSIRGLLDREDARSRNRPSGANPRAEPVPTREPTQASQRPVSTPPRRGLGLLAAAAGLGVIALAWWWVAGDRVAPDPTSSQVTSTGSASTGSNWVQTTFSAYGVVADTLVGTGPDSDSRTEPPDELAVRDGDQLEARWRAANLTFPARFIDLSMMGIEVVAGDVRPLGSRQATLAVYQADTGPIACWMFAADRSFEADLPTPVDQHRFGEFEFRVYRDADRTLVVWREGGVICVLMGRGDPDEIIRLAHEKAMAPQTA